MGCGLKLKLVLKKKDLQKAIQKRIKIEFNGKIAEIEKVDHHSKGIFYDVEFKQKGKNKDIEFKANRDIIN